jgi:GT2 family glycosyltransferase
MKALNTRGVDLTGVGESLDDLTICIPVFDRAETVTACLNQLQKQEANKLKVIVVDTGSQDGTPELIEAQIKNGWWKPPCFRPELDMRVIRLGEVKGKAAGVIAAMQCFQKEVTTPLMMRIEPDILIPPNALKPMVAMFKADDKLGMLAIGYDPLKNHVPTDCTMFRMSEVKKLTWQWTSQGCDCLHAFNELNALGLKVMFHATLRSRHLTFL